MSFPRTKVEILDSDLNVVTEVRSLYPLNEAGMVLTYSKELSDYGECRFRIAAEDPLFDEYGDIINPHQYHVRIKRENATVWQGAIVDNPERNKKYHEVLAYQYLYYLDKVLVKLNDTMDGVAGTHFRIFDSGTMSSNINTLITEVKSAFGANHIMANLTAGDIENPDFPNNFTKTNGDPLTGAWTFGSNISLTFSYQSVLYVLTAFGMYSLSDFEIDDDLNFNFKKYLGRNKLDLAFLYSARGNMVDYDIPRYGQRQYNSVVGVAVQDTGKFITATKKDQASISTYGLLQTAAIYGDIKHKNALNVRLSEELRLVSEPENSPLSLVLNEKAYPHGVYEIGDTVRVKIKDNIIDYNKPRRIVGINVNLHNTGREMTVVTTNPPQDKDSGG